MKTVQANSYEQTAKSLEDLQTGLSQRISEEIRADEKNHYHLVTVKIRAPKYGEVNGKVDLVIVKTYKRQFDKLSKNHHYFGYSHVFLLHNPELNEHEEVTVETSKKEIDVEAIKREAIAEVKKELEEKNEAFLKEMREKYSNQEAGSVSETVSEDQKQVSKIQGYINAITEGKEINLEEFSKQHPNQLNQFAKEFGIDLKGTTKKEIMPTIISWIEEHNQGLKN